MESSHTHAYAVAVNMGYGHERALFPLIDISATPQEWNITEPMIISANNYPTIPRKDRIIWTWTRRMYESISRIQGFPLLGRKLFSGMDYLEKIDRFYPRRNLSKPNFRTRMIYFAIRRGFGKHLIDVLNKNPLPLITSFFITAFFAEEHGYKGNIYCLCTDTDISRVWVSKNPSTSRIIYLAPNNRVKERLKLYGIPEERIVMTGFPLPKETIGSEKHLEVARVAMRRRIQKLDANGLYQKKYEKLLHIYLGKEHHEAASPDPVTITFAVGGAGAQAHLGVRILKSLAKPIRENRVRLNLVAGTSHRVLEIFEQTVRDLGFENDSRISILFTSNHFEYFRKFNELLISTDILWTKPSELSFYVGLGLPIIMAPAIGAQEESNKAWLHIIDAGFEQEDPDYTHEWLFDWLRSGWLAAAAMNGFIDAPKRGTYHIEDLVLRGKKVEIENIHFI